MTVAMSYDLAMARGHIRTRPNGTFQVLVYAGRDPVTMRQRYLSGTAKTRKDAEKLLTSLLGQVDEQRSPTTRATVAYLLDRWLEVTDLELTTRLTYEGYIQRSILPVLGDLPLRKVTVDVLDRFYVHLHARGGRGGGALAPGTVRKLHFILRAAFGLAVRWGWLSANPAELAKPPRFVQAEVHPPTPAQVAQLLNAAWARDPDFATLLWLAMTTGARRGELCALRWPDVRLEERDLLVARNYVQRGRHRKEKDTKTHQSRRIALDAETIAVLAEHLERCRARAGTGGMELVADGYVFSLVPDGREPLVPDSVTQRFRRLAKRVGVATHLHEFRHYSATQLIAAGVDLRTVAGRLGHGGGGATTLRVYSHWVAASDQRAAELLGRSVPRPGSRAPFAG